MAALEPLKKSISIEMSGDTKLYMVSAKQGDKATRYVVAELLNDGMAYTIPTGARVAINIKKPDGKFVYNTCSYSGSEVTFELTNQALAAAGTAYCDIEVRTSDNAQIITSASFTIEIEESMRKDGAIMSSNEFTELEDRIAGHIKDFNDKGEAVMQAEAERVNAEKIRQQNESARIQQENTRQENYDRAVKSAEDAAGEATKATNDCKDITEQANAVIIKADNAAENANVKATEAETAANNAKKISEDLIARRDAGEFDGKTGPQGPPGENGIITQINGFFTLSGDADGNLWAYYADADNPPRFDVDDEGNIYYETPEE